MIVPLFEPARRVRDLPPYLFAELDAAVARAVKKGKDVISLGVGDPDMPTPDLAIEAMKTALHNPEHHQYPPYDACESFRSAAATWMKSRFQCTFDPEKEIIALLGSKEGLAHLPLAFINPGDVGIVPDPGYPVYANAIRFAEGTPHSVPLLEENQYLPDLTSIPASILEKTKLFFINYPNNPTSACASPDFFKDLVELAHQHKFLIVQDAAYSEIFFERKPPSIFKVDGARDVAMEIHSLSKTFNMTGWRIGFAAGGKRAISNLLKIKTNVDSGTFGAIQETAAKVFLEGHKDMSHIRETYMTRRNLVMTTLESMGINAQKPEATFFVWAKVPHGESSIDFCKKVLDNASVLITPGAGFGKHGEGYFRISLTVPDDRLQEAMARIKDMSL